MECGILRVKQITAGGIAHIGGEEDRTHGNARNGDIDTERAHLNMGAYREPGQTLYRAWQDKCKALGVSATRKGQTAMEQAVITASPEFFVRAGWDKTAAKGWTVDDIPHGITQYFEDALEWAQGYFGAKNIISATIHMDETTPHMHIDYVPVAEASKHRKDVYARDADGRLLRDGKGHAIRARDATGKVLYEYVDAPARLSRSDYWQQRGGRQSYRKMQDQFYACVSRKYGLERGEIGTGREHIEQERYKADRAKQERQAHEKAVQTAQQEAKQAAQQTAQYRQAIVDNVAIIKAQREEYSNIQEKLQDLQRQVEETQTDYDMTIKAAQEAAEQNKILVGNFGKTLTGKTIITPEQVEQVEKLQGSLIYTQKRLETAQAETARAEARCDDWMDKYQQRGVEAKREKARADRAEAALSQVQQAVDRLPDTARKAYEQAIRATAKVTVTHSRGRSGGRVHMLKDTDDLEL